MRQVRLFGSHIVLVLLTITKMHESLLDLLFIFVNLGLGLLLLDHFLLIGSHWSVAGSLSPNEPLQLIGEHVFQEQEFHENKVASPGAHCDLLQLRIEGGTVVLVLKDVQDFLVLADDDLVPLLVLLSDLVSLP